MRIGSLTSANPFVLAPMDGYSDAAFRAVCRNAGAGLCFSEMIPAVALVHNAVKPRESLRIEPSDHPVVVQVSGADPATMREAARLAEAAGADAVDVNAGCPSRRVTNGGAGAALLSDLPRLAAILKAVREAIRVPLTLKVRVGPTADRIVLDDLARIAQDCGVDAVTVHARTRAQRFLGRADWRFIARFRERASMTVIGNGDVQSAADAFRMIRETGCDGVMVGRAAIGNPWIFTQMVALWSGGPAPRDPDLSERRAAILAHYDSLVRVLGGDEARAARVFRKHLARYVRGLPGALRVRRALPGVSSRADLLSTLGALGAACEDAGGPPRSEAVTETETVTEAVTETVTETETVTGFP